MHLHRSSHQAGSIAFALAATLLLLLTPATAQATIPTASNFIRRATHASAVLNSTLYIDGGLFSQYINGTLDTLLPRQLNATLALPLHHPWTNATAPLTAIPKPPSAPIYKYADLWTDAAGTALYSWVGETPSGSPPALSLWRFTPTAADPPNGTWAAVDARDPAAFNQLARPAGGYSASCRGAGWYLGGYTSGATDARWGDGGAAPVPGMVSYNYSSGAWRNVSVEGFAGGGTAAWGKMADVPFGEGGGGVLAVLGGEGGDREVLRNTEGGRSFANVSLYDPVRDRWFGQFTTGEAPGVRDGFCMVGAQGKNGSFELFVYGGWLASKSDVYSDVYILSLPGFHWFKGPSVGAPRMQHSCNVIGSGNRQMLAIGGLALQWQPSSEQKWKEPDEWRNGLGVFDMKTLEWTDSYDPDLEYDTPDVIKQWYSDGGEAAWTSNSVKALFSETSTSSASSSSSSAGGGSSSDSNDSSSSSSNTGAVVGGVVGGVAGLALILGALWCLRRRKQRQLQEKYEQQESPRSGSSVNNSFQAHEMDNSDRAELDWNAQNAELDSTMKTELDSTAVIRVPQRISKARSGAYELPV
ncbi:Kelch repeat protein [Neofusicoccum parvum]|nr:Kelch repeat protein [Neofusicoccum parvum]